MAGGSAGGTLFRATTAALFGATLLTGTWLAASLWKGYSDVKEFEVGRSGAEGGGRRAGVGWAARRGAACVPTPLPARPHSQRLRLEQDKAAK